MRRKIEKGCRSIPLFIYIRMRKYYLNNFAFVNFNKN